MSGSLSAEVEDIGRAPGAGTSSPPAPDGGGTPVHLSLSGSTSPGGPLVVVPAGILGDVVGSLGGTIGGELGAWFGDRALGKTLGGAAGELIKGLSPWSVVPPAVAPAATGPSAGGAQEGLVVMPAGFLTGLLGGVGGKLLGGAVGGLFGNKRLGEQLGGSAGGALGSIFGPFSVVPPEQVAPSASDTGQEAQVVVPAGWLGHLFGGVARGVGQLVGGDTAKAIGDITGDLAEKFVPWSALPPNLVPASAGPAGAQQTEDLVLVPAGWFGRIASTFGGTIGRGIGSWLGNAKVGERIGTTAGQLLKSLSVLPDPLQPASAGPDGGGSEEDKLVVVPAGLLGGLLGSLGGLFDARKPTLEEARRSSAELATLAVQPFSVVPSAAAWG